VRISSQGLDEFMGKLAFVFPGQASQYSGMGKDLADHYPVARAVFEEADAALGFSISRICFAGSDHELKQTAHTQPAILTVSVAAYRALAERGITPEFVAGHSLGEYSALVAASSLKLSDAVKLVHHRGKYMQEAVPAGDGAMAAILGLAPAEVADICKKAADGDIVVPANMNSPEQTVISGQAAAVKRAVEIASQNGAKRAVMLPVSAPFHCDMMAPARERLTKDLRATVFGALKFPLITNVDAEAVTTGDEAREALIRQVCSPVRWLESIHELVESGVSMFVEVGPGKVLTGLLRQIDRSVHCVNVEDSASLQKTVDKISQARAEVAEA
jgi:[acyl-carrier-protein] S-malonyltransferase